MLKKETIIEIVNLCEVFANGLLGKKITKESYTQNFKEPYLVPFENKYKLSPNKIIQEELKVFFNKELSVIDEKIKIRNFGYWGNNIYSYVWSCIYFDFGNPDLAASYSPQLYILINKMGIKFGFCYGHQITDNSELVSLVRNDKIPVGIKRLNESKISFFNSSLNDITARPEVLFGSEERILLNSKEDLLSNWSNKSLLIKEYPVNEIPLNISDEIQNTFLVLKEFFLSMLPIKLKNTSLNSVKFDHNIFHNVTEQAGLFFSLQLIVRFVSSLLTKPFVILTGLSGSGKTKLAQAFVQWICESKEQYKIVPVGADWTNREPLLGYPNGLNETNYVLPESGSLQLMIEATKISNENKPFFLILDEMNLSHVERYFADFLSIMESGRSIKLHDDKKRENGGLIVEKEISWPKNLFIIGTVNIDETTYMFSPKVLDRANVIEFRVEEDEMQKYLDNFREIKMNKLFIDGDENKSGIGAEMAVDFLSISKGKHFSDYAKADLKGFFPILQKAGAEFGYRSASEINYLIGTLEYLTKDDKQWDNKDVNRDKFTDIAIMQKLLPKLHGSRTRLIPVLTSLGRLCIKDKYEESEKGDKQFIKEYFDSDLSDKEIIFKMTFDKIKRMYKNVIVNGFTSYAEA